MLCSGREMAERVGCAVETIYSVESKRLSPSIFILNRIADAYGITIDQAFKCVKVSPRLAGAIEEFNRLKEAGVGEAE